ncbi:hypothetical protein [Pseudoalteromonas sp. T1lg75]|uniref:hypothetical protein n=1 Tax=Pseudoalteromonas sp. T1lg75 TaxID=2077102 RepID=UPI000CF7256A|nr:hypothetical protein [Pseudoalteromonas sp. T1lg75]
MNQVIEKITKKRPTCLEGFNVSSTDAVLPTNWNNGDSFITKQISCTCGNSQLKLLTYEFIEKKGFFKKREIVKKCSPVYVECPECNSNKLLFNPEVHGWNGEQNENKPQLDSVGAVPFTDKAGKVYVTYSYQGTENYEEMLEDDELDNPQDFFDTFTVYFEETEQKLSLVTTDECA